MLKHLKLENFRSHKIFDLELEETNVLLGENGAGKSNILEALSLLSFCRSFREDDRRNLINYESEFARVTGDELEIFLCRYPRLLMQAKKRGVALRTSQFVGNLPAVVFSAESSAIVTGPPSERRRFLDLMISQTDREYFSALMEFKKVKTQRNNLLINIRERKSREDELQFWDKEFIKLSIIIQNKREKAVQEIGNTLSEVYLSISGDEDASLSIRYDKSGGEIEKSIMNLRQRDIICGKTTVGPHRDDFVLALGQKNAANFASRGEIRSAVLSLKICELKYIEDNRKGIQLEKKNKPILLLDDLFSELDDNRKKHVSELILNYQTLITSTEKELLPENLIKSAKITEL